MAASFSGILMLALMSGGIGDTDLINFVQPTHYFKARSMEISVDRAMEYASEDPATAKAQIVQLSALRYLADEAQALRKSAKYADHRKVLAQIAAGKKANDPEGFAQDYANRVLAKLDGVKPAPVKFVPLRGEALNWFPANVTLGGALDLRQTRQPAAGGPDPVKDILKMIPEREKKEMYDAIEKCGNVRVDRVAYAHTNGTGKDNGDGKNYVRVTGKANQQWLTDLFMTLDRGRLQATKSKDAQGTPITVLQSPNDSTAVMLVGNADLLIVGFDRRGKSEDLVNEILDTRSKKKPHAAAGSLKDRLANIPDRAIGLLVGEVPEEMKRGLAFTFNPVPANITAFVERAEQGMDVQVATSMASPEDADKLVRKVAELRKKGIDELKKEMQQPRRPGEPPIPFQSMINVLETLQVQSKDDKVQARAVVPDSLIREMTNGMLLWGASSSEPKVDLKKCGEQ